MEIELSYLIEILYVTNISDQTKRADREEH